jgi:hypothetical protein
MVGISIQPNVTSEAVQMDVHQLQVSRYPSWVFGGNRFQINSRRGAEIWSVVMIRARRKVAKVRVRRVMGSVKFMQVPCRGSMSGGVTHNHSSM